MVRANKELEEKITWMGDREKGVDELEHLVNATMMKLNRRKLLLSQEEKLSRTKKIHDIKNISSRLNGK